jgi:hypothetical protein
MANALNDYTLTMSKGSKDIFDKWWNLTPKTPYTDPLEHRLTIMQKELILHHYPNMQPITKIRAKKTLNILEEQIIKNFIANEDRLEKDAKRKLELTAIKEAKEKRKLELEAKKIAKLEAELEAKKLAQQEAQAHLL